MEFELPHLEDIYDFDERELLRVKEGVARMLETPSSLTEKVLYKAKRILELIDVELDERISVNQIAIFCARELTSELYSEISDQQSVVASEAPSTADEDTVWSQRRNISKKEYTQFVRKTLANTQESRGVMVGASSVKPSTNLRTSTKKIEERSDAKASVLRKPLHINHRKERRQSAPHTDEKPKAMPKQTTSAPRQPAKRKTIICFDKPVIATPKSQSNSAKPKVQNLPRHPPNVSVKSSEIERSETNVQTPSHLSSQNLQELDTSQLAFEIKATEPDLDPTPYTPLARSFTSGTPANVYNTHMDLGVIQPPDYTIIQSGADPADCTETSQDLCEPHVKTSLDPKLHPELLDKDEAPIKEEGLTSKLTIFKESLRIEEPDYDSFVSQIDVAPASNFSADSYSAPLPATPSLITHAANVTQIEINHAKSAISQEDSESDYEDYPNKPSEVIVLGQATDVEILPPMVSTTHQPTRRSDLLKQMEGIPTIRPQQAIQSSASIPKQPNKQSSSLSAKLPSNITEPSRKEKSMSRPVIVHTTLTKALEAMPKEQFTQPKQPLPQKPPQAVLSRQPSSMSRSISSSSIKRPPGPPPSKPVLPPANIVDYSGSITHIGQIFAGFGHSKDFDLLIAMRDAILVFKDFDSMLSLPEIEFQRKFKLSLAPLEISPLDLIRNRPDIEEMHELTDKEMYYRVVRARPEVYDIVSRSFAKLKGWSELPHGMNLRASWNVMWTWSKPRIDLSKLCIWQAVNHFPESKNFSRKDLLKSNIERIQKLSHKCQIVWNITPVTYCLPKESMQFLDHFAKLRDAPLNLWIMKPVGKSRGRGITVVSDITQVTYGEPMVIQQYISRPLLLGGFKFDMRIYVLITSFNPLEVFLYRQGFARLSTVPYSLNPDKLKNRFIHLTNYSVQKSNAYAQGDPSDLMYGGSKICLKALRERLSKIGISFDDIWDQVKEIVLKSLIACASEIPSYKCCFDLVGYDIIIDQDLRAWLLEVNSSPSLARDHFIDDLIKQQLIDDTLDIVNPTFFNKTHLIKVLQRRLAELQRGVNNNSQAVLNADLTSILDGKQRRSYGEYPTRLGNYERIAPSELLDRLSRMTHRSK